MHLQPKPTSYNNCMKSLRIAIIPTVLIFCIFSSGCFSSSRRPENTENICDIFRENPAWYKNARKSYQKWGVPLPVIIAIMYQESSLIPGARPPRTTCLWVFPGPRPSSAFGYAQAKDETWKEYQKSTGNMGAKRDNFRNAFDFVGWYCSLSSKRCGISKKDAYHLYLAYHEGHGGFNRKTYQKKAWLLRVADRVRKRADKYKRQMVSCEKELQKKGGCCLWPFR